MALHPWWIGFGETVPNISDLTIPASRALAVAAASGNFPGLRLVEIRKCTARQCEAVHIEIDVERPQDLAAEIIATEPIAFIFAEGDFRPSIVALRDDFPDTMHQNWTPSGLPCSLCIDDRPWSEAKLTSTTADLIRRTHLWLAKAARGELHDAAQPLDSLFYQSQLTLVIPGEALEAGDQTVELVGYVRDDNPNILIAAPLSEAMSRRPGFIAMAFLAAPQTMSRMRHAPSTLPELVDALRALGVDLLGELKTKIRGWAGLQDDNLRRLASRLAVIIAFPVTQGDRSANDLRAFLTYDTVGEIGVALGVLEKNISDTGSTQAYVPLIVARAAADTVLKIEPAQVHFRMARPLARSIAGHGLDDNRKAVLVGAGALGSQLSLNLAREGLLSWSIFDSDFLLPHNFARHALFAGDVGAPKAAVLARQLAALLGEPVAHHVQDVTSANLPAAAITDFQQADFVLDASASVPVSRYLCDFPGVSGRRVSIFFNPAGTALVLLAEDVNRSISLRDVEAQYYKFIISTPALAGHLATPASGLRYSGSCRALTNRIPASRAAMLSAIAAEAIKALLQNSSAAIRIWTINNKNEVTLEEMTPAPVTDASAGDWAVSCDAALIEDLARMRSERLPNETGGVLLGIIDVSRRSIHVLAALPQPSDSVGSPGGFERGVVALDENVRRSAEATMHQIRYIGEWHSHPRGIPPLPSATDLHQLAWLREEMSNEGLPALMAIAGDGGAFSFILASDVPVAADPSSRAEASL